MAQNGGLYHPVQVGGLSIGGNLFLAPVAGYSDCAFRFLCKQGGADFAYTEMVSAEALVRGSAKTELLMKRAENEAQYAVQIFGGSEQSMKGAAKIVLQRAKPEMIDINAGCPVPKIVKTGAGSALTRDPDRLYAVTKAVVDSVAEEGAEVPVTVKIRSGWDGERLTWKEAAEAALAGGAAALTLHSRTRAQGYEGKADHGILAQLVQAVAGRVPVFASGDMFTPENARDVLEQTACDGVMFARGAMGNPFIFSETRHFLLTGEHKATPSEERIKAGMKELDILALQLGELSACREMRKRFCAYSKGLPNGAQMRSAIVAACTKADFAKIFAPYL